MIKTLSIAISAMVVLIASLFSDPDPGIAVTSKVAPRLVPGEDCLVSVTISKGAVSGYAILQQILPHGLRAVPVETMGAEFKLEENVVKFEWMNLPTDNSITVSYQILTDPNETDLEQVHGSFFYLADNKTVKVDLAPMALNFSATGTGGPAEVERSIFAVKPQSGEYKVELTIHRRTGEHSARFMDIIPEGYTVTDINTCGAQFMFSNQQATFRWAQLPEEPVFKISYRLLAKSDQYENPSVTGMLVYDDDATSQVDVASSPADPVSGEPATASNVTASADESSVSQVSQENEKSTRSVEFESSPQMAVVIPAPQKGIFYKIQIAATKKSPVRSSQYFENKYHFGQQVDLTEHEGWRKYMIGNFDSYASAYEFSHRTKEKVPDAFVVAYRNAERITIREAAAESMKAD